jgi:TPR repeat protein
LAAFGAPVTAGPFEDAIAAYSRSDYAIAFRLFHLPAEQGNVAAQLNLSDMYYYGRGVTQGYAKAAKWFRKAAEQGHASAQTGLGFMYHYGQGVTQDYVEAHKWWNIAASKGDANAAKYGDNVAKRMTSAQIAEAQKLAREWRPK